MQRPILINVSRGGLVNTDSLIRGLRAGQLSGAGLDVLETEPLVAAELLQFENVILTPHAAWFSVEASERLRRSAIADILRVLSGQTAASSSAADRVEEQGNARIRLGSDRPRDHGMFYMDPVMLKRKPCYTAEQSA